MEPCCGAGQIVVTLHVFVSSIWDERGVVCVSLNSKKKKRLKICYIKKKKKTYVCVSKGCKQNKKMLYDLGGHACNLLNGKVMTRCGGAFSE